MYFNEVRGPSEHDISTITTAAHLAGIAIERARNEEAREHSETAYRALLEAIPDMMFRVDRAGTYLDFHAPDPRRLMVPPPKFMGRTVREVLPRERAEQCMEALERMFATSETQLYEYEVRRTDAATAWWEVRVVRARRDEALLLLRDVTERREAERRLRESEQRLRLLVQGAPLAVVSWNLDFTIAGWNPGAARIFGYTEGEAVGQHARLIIPESARDTMDVAWRDLLANRGGYRTTTQSPKKSGELVYCDWYNAPLVDTSGKVIGVASIIEDVTERKLAQQRTDFMMAELDHRVKNNLAAVISLAEQTGRGTSSYRQFLDTFMGRLRAMSRMHSILARSRWQGADLRTLVTQTLEAFGSGTFGRASVNGPEAMMLPRAAQAIAMALNELATNAVKYGALSAQGGHVSVDWTITDAAPGQRWLRLRWQESGGPPVSPPSRRGFGSELIEGAIAYELKGTAKLEFEPEGVVCDIHIPYLSEVESHDPGAPIFPIDRSGGIAAIDSRPMS
jgi:PAS domain S-box-containing protein